MTWYYVALWPGYGYALQSMVVEATWEAPAIAKAAKYGCGETMDTGQYEMYLNSIGVAPEDEADYEDEDWVWFDEPEAGFMGYVNIRHAIIREAEPEDMLELQEINYQIKEPLGGHWIKVSHESGEEFRSAVYSLDPMWLRSEIRDVHIQGERYLFGDGHTLEELLDELNLSDADQIASRNFNPKKKGKRGKR